ncbi:protein kinase domain-containing protein [Pseudalkalibacillus decolorationis]|uniref:protein kinase domain-containing protein n=1 Tax=Pseudalkalibacillus decolorationis TaxID=163879 RepID=UPI0027E21A26|nr:phosphotransferase [Pseudalkalibacillus decolorationis]
MNTSKNPEANITPGSIILGKWSQNQYTILRELGSGATGTVYLARGNGTKVALKVSSDSLSITSEVNVLKYLSKVQGKKLGPSFIEMDDWVHTGRSIPFYVMEYVQGDTLFSFMKQRKDEWFGIILIQLLGDLHDLHNAGWVFGDLKPDNLLISGPPPKIRWLDVGGTTMVGRAIKEYTEFFDRGFWGLGSRRAEPSYDLFAVAMIIINFAYPSRFEKKEGGWEQLKRYIDKERWLRKYSRFLDKAINGQYQSALEMKQDLLSYYSKKTSPTIHKRTKSISYHKKPNPQMRYQKKKVQKRRGYLETILIVLIMFAFYVIYLIGHM